MDTEKLKSNIVTSFFVVICSFVLLTAIAIFMSQHSRQPADPVIDYLNEIHNRPTQPFGGPRKPFDNTPEIHEADESKLPVLRKLHLVRPDLINYPIQMETYC